MNRIQLLLSRLLLLPLLLLLPGSDWPQIFGTNRNSSSDEKSLLTRWPAGGPEIVWQQTVGEGYSGPVVAGDRLILFHRLNREETVECLNARTGQLIWKRSFASNYRDSFGKGDGPRSTPVIAGRSVYTLGPAGRLDCLDLETGKVIWEKELGESYSLRRNFFGIGTTPLIEGDLLLLNIGSSSAGIIALNKETGKEVWKATDDDASYASPVAATVGGKRIVVFFTREGLVGINPADGMVLFGKRWRARIEASVNAASPLVLEDQVFVTSSYQTGALMVQIKGKELETLWKGEEILSCHYSSPVVVDGVLFGMDGRQEQGTQLRAVDWKTGKVLWTEEGINSGSLIAANGFLIILSEDGKLRLVEATGKGYHEISSASVLAGPCRAPIALAHGLLYARGRNKLICFQIRKN